MSRRRCRQSPDRQNDVAVGATVAQFLDMLAAERGAARNTVDAYGRDLADYSAFLQTCNRTVEDVDTACIRAYLAALAGAGFSSPRRRRAGSSVPAAQSSC